MNETARKFGYPASLLHERERWCVLLRPAQVTLGSLILVCKDPAKRFGQISPEASAELRDVAADIESALSGAFQHDKINYLMLMMVDPDVHFHVIPRYREEREFAGERIADPFWPGPPDVTRALPLPEQVVNALRTELQGRFAALG